MRARPMLHLPLLLVLASSHATAPASQATGAVGPPARVPAEAPTPILRLEALLEARVLGVSGVEVARLHDLLVHRETGLVTRAVLHVLGEGAATKALPYTALVWDEELGALRVDATVATLRALPDFDPARVARRSARWTAEHESESAPERAPRTESAPLLYALAGALVGRELACVDGEPRRVASLYVAPSEGRLVAWAARTGGGRGGSEVLLPWPVVAEAPAEGGARRCALRASASTAQLARLVRYAPRGPLDLGPERPRLRALFRAFELEPPALLAEAAPRAGATVPGLAGDGSDDGRRAGDGRRDGTRGPLER